MKTPSLTTRAAALAAGLICGALLSVILSPAVVQAAGAPPDSLIKASTAAVYYFAADGKRYVFPTEGVYGSWFGSFDGIVSLSEAELAAMPLGGNVTYRPGIRLVKIQTDPKVYAVSPGGRLRWVSSEAVAAALYGPDWNKYVDDLSDALFADYSLDQPITDAASWKPAVAAALALTINADKGIAVGSAPRQSDTAPPAVSADAAPGAAMSTGTDCAACAATGGTAAAAGGVYYVSPAGSDANPGSLAQPWRTIQYAADRLTAGDTVYLRSGTYRERVLPRNSGQSDRWITYAAYPGEVPVLDGSGVEMPADQAGLFGIVDRNFIKLSGLKVTNVRGDLNSNGILVDRSGDVIIEKCVTYDTESSGIGVWASRNVTLDGNEIELAGHGGQQESLSVAGTDNFAVHDNILRGGGDKEGICLKDGSSNGRVYRNEIYGVPAVGLYLDAWDKHTHDIWVYQNVVHGVTGSDGLALASEMGGLLENIYVNNNVVYGNRYIGLKVSRNGDATAHPMRNIQIINNTAYGNGQEWGGCLGLDDPDASGVVVRNNLCSQNRSFEISLSADIPAGGVTIENNLIFSFKGDTEDGETSGSRPVEADPLLVDPAKADFHLRSGSPAIDRGSALGAPAVDFDGRLRPQGAAVDIGAFEY